MFIFLNECIECDYLLLYIFFVLFCFVFFVCGGGLCECVGVCGGQGVCVCVFFFYHVSFKFTDYKTILQ